MMIDFLEKHWRDVVDIFIFMLVIFLIIIQLLMTIRTRYFWKPRVGDTVLTHGYKKAVGNIVYIHNSDSFTVEHNSEYDISISSWKINQVTFLTRGRNE